MSTKNQEPKFDIALLLRAAAMVNLDPMDVPGDVNPWQWSDPRAKGWQSAIRVLNPSLADAAEAAWGPAMTLGLRAALAGETAWTADLEKELEVRRPGLAKERRDAAVNAALEQMAETRRAEQEARTARTPTPEQLRAQQLQSKNVAAAQAARDYLGVTA